MNIQFWFFTSIFFLPLTMSISYLAFLVTFILFIVGIIKKDIEVNYNTLDCPILFFFLASLLSLINLCQPYANSQKASTSVLMLLAVTMFYFITKSLFDGEKDYRKLIKLFLVQGIILAIYGIVQYIGSNYSIRVTSFTSNPNTLPNYFIIIVPLVMTLFYSCNSIKGKLLIAISITSMLVCLFLTFSRGGYWGILATSLCFITLNNKKVVTWFIGLGVLLSPLAIYYSLFYRVGSQLERIAIWQSSWKMFKDHPLIGIGLGQFKPLYPLYIMKPYTYIHPHAQSIIFQRFVEVGIIGGVAFLWLIYKISLYSVHYFKLKKIDDNHRRVFSACVSGLLGVLVHGLIDDPLYPDGTYLLTWCIIGVLASLHNMYCRENNGARTNCLVK